MFSKLKISAYLVVLSLMASLDVSADTTTNQIIETNLEPIESFDFSEKINGSVGFGYGLDFNAYEGNAKEQSLNFNLEITLKHNDWKYGLNTSAYKILMKEEKTELGDTSFFALKPLYLFSTESSFSSSLFMALALPTSKLSRYEKTMYGNLSAGQSIAWKRDNLNISLAPRVGKVFNKYKTTYSGEANTSYYSKISLSPTYQFTNNLTTQFITSFTQSWTDNNTRKAPTYSSELNTELKMDTDLSLGLAIANEGKIYKSNGTSSNLKIFDRNLSVYSLTVTKDF